MADLPSGDPPSEDEQTLADGEQTLADGDQMLADGDQTLADTDQTLADTDQSGADSDQVSSDRDQFAADRDQAASDRDLAHGVDRGSHEFSRELRVRSTRQRGQTDESRLSTAEQRDAGAATRDLAAGVRDQAAAGRDRAMTQREALAHQLAIAETDALTGARTRAAGLIDLDHELARCRRDGGVLVVAYIDVVGLKALNDSRGHSAGDALLQRVVAVVRSQLRSYDLIIRLGGDEFLCAMSNISLPDARDRFDGVTSTLATSAGGGAIRTGFAELTADDSGPDLIARADDELIAGRG